METLSFSIIGLVRPLKDNFMADDASVIDDTSKVTVDSDTDNNDNTDDSADESNDVEQLKEQNKKLFERAKKAEGFVKDDNGNWIKKLKPVVKTEPQQKQDDSLSSKDIYALMEAKVPQQHIDEVTKAAKLLNLSIPEALKDGLVIARLKDLAEKEQTANATNTSGSKRTTVKVTDENVIEQARQGKAIDPEALAQARINLALQKKK